MRLLIKNLIPMLFFSRAVLVTMPIIAHAEVISTEVVIEYTIIYLSQFAQSDPCCKRIYA
jgi:hypothetical protein